MGHEPVFGDLVPGLSLDHAEELDAHCQWCYNGTDGESVVPFAEEAKQMEARTRRDGRNLPAIQIKARGETLRVYRYRDVLNLAYQHGLIGFEQAAPLQVVMVPSQRDPDRMVPMFISEVYAVFRNEDGSIVRFHGVGDCSYENAHSSVAAAGPRMAHTRAKARALADALNLDANLSEEFDLSEDFAPHPGGNGSPGSESQNRPSGGYRCSRCGSPMSERSAAYSQRVRGELVCYRCAKESS